MGNRYRNVDDVVIPWKRGCPSHRKRQRGGGGSPQLFYPFGTRTECCGPTECLGYNVAVHPLPNPSGMPLMSPGVARAKNGASHQQSVRALTTRKVAFLGFACILLSLEFWRILVSEQVHVLPFHWVLPLVILLGLCGWKPAIGGVGYIGLVTIASLLPNGGIDLGLVVLGTFAVALDWISRGWWFAGALALIVSQVAEVATTETPAAAVLGALLGSSLAIPGGTMLRRFERREVLLERDSAAVRGSLEIAQRSLEHVRQDLASTLHDTLAADLVRIAMSSHSLAMLSNTSDVAEIAHELEEASHATLRDLRAMIAATGQPKGSVDSSTVASTLDTCRSMLAARSIDLAVEAPDDLDERCSIDTSKMLRQVIQEGSVNILKYAAAGSEAFLTVERSSHGDLDLLLVSECGEEPSGDAEVFSGGFGLESLEARVAASGGLLRASLRESRWILAVHLVDLAREYA